MTVDSPSRIDKMLELLRAELEIIEREPVGSNDAIIAICEAIRTILGAGQAHMVNTFGHPYDLDHTGRRSWLISVLTLLSSASREYEGYHSIISETNPIAIASFILAHDLAEVQRGIIPPDFSPSGKQVGDSRKTGPHLLAIKRRIIRTLDAIKREKFSYEGFTDAWALYLESIGLSEAKLLTIRRTVEGEAPVRLLGRWSAS